MAVSTKIQHRRDTAANWTTTNPTLASGEIGFETDTLKFKVGNGSTAWTSLKYSQDASLLSGTASITDLTTTANVTAGNTLKSTNSTGSEGGQIELSKSVNNTTINTGVTIDVYENRLRFFETGSPNRGYYVDITTGGSLVGTSLTSGSTGAMNYAQTEGTKQSTISSAGTTIVSVSITTNGYPVLVSVTGDVENNSAGGWVVLQLYRGATAIGNPVHAESSAGSENVPYALTVIDAPAAGTYTYALKLNNSAGGTFNFGESDGPVITAIELSGPKGDAGAAGPTFNGGTITNALAVSNTINTTGQFTSTYAGAPFVVSNTTVVTNLNADLLDGQHRDSTSVANTVVSRDASQNFAANTITANLFGTANLATYIVGGLANKGQIVYQSGVNTTSQLAAPATNNSTLLYNTSTNAPYWIQPTLSNTYFSATTAAQLINIISNTTGTAGNLVFSTQPVLSQPNIGAAIGTSVNVTGQFISTVASPTPPFSVASTSQVANLNAATSGSTSNVLGGAAGQIHYQNAANSTTFLSAPATNNSVLTYNTSTNAPEWDTPTATMAFLTGYTSTVTAAGATSLTNTSTYYQQFTGTSTQVVVMPNTATLTLGWTFHVVNNSTGNVTANTFGNTATLITIPSGTTAMITCIDITANTAAAWEAGLTDFSTYTGSGAVVLGTSPSFTNAGAPFAVSNTTTVANLTSTYAIRGAIVGNTAPTVANTLNMARIYVSNTTPVDSLVAGDIWISF